MADESQLIVGNQKICEGADLGQDESGPRGKGRCWHLGAQVCGTARVNGRVEGLLRMIHWPKRPEDCIRCPWILALQIYSLMFYNRREDPFEQQNLIDRAAAPSGLCDDLLAKLRSNVNHEVVAGAVEVEEVVLRRLQDLGYL